MDELFQRMQARAYANAFAVYNHIELETAEEDRAVLRLTAVADSCNPYGIIHGGVHCSVVETLASIGAAHWLGDRGQVVGVNNNTDFFSAVREGALVSTATPLHRGRSQQLWLVETIIEVSGRIAARGQVRLQNLYPDAQGASSR